ncbi:MAG: alpha/beta fold hydrolase [Acidobacteriota bacterium]
MLHHDFIPFHLDLVTSRPWTLALIVAMVLGCALPLAAQDGGADPEFLKQYAETYRFRLGKPTRLTPTPEGDSVLFLRSGPRDFVRDLWVFDRETGEERKLLTAEDLLGGGEETLTEEEKARRERQRLAARGIATFDLSDDGTTIVAPLSGSLYLVDRASGAVRSLTPEAGFPIDPQMAPPGDRVAYVVDGDLWVWDLESGAERRLTERTSETVTYGLAEFVAQEEMSRHHGYWWSPDGDFLAYQRSDTDGLPTFHIADPMDPAVPPQAWPYPRAGAKNAEVELGIMPVAGGETVWVDWDREQYPYLAHVTWPSNGPLSILVQNRHQTEQVLYAVEPSDGSVRELVVEKDDAWVEIDNEMPRWLGEQGFLWTTERNGGRQLELRAPDGSLRWAVTEPGFGYRNLIQVSADRRFVWVRASDDPTQSHIWQLPLEVPSDLGETALTDNPGVHNAVFSPDGSLRIYALDFPFLPPRWEVRDGNDTVLGRLDSLAENPSSLPRLQYVTVGEDLVFHAALVRPRDFDKTKKYPVIVKVYGGPTSQVVQRSRNRYAFEQWMADQGFVVVLIDNRGTPNRDREWTRALKNNFVDIVLEDQEAVLRQLGERFGELDLDRVGMYGWSYGGYISAMAAMRRGELFKAGVAGAPVTDWHDYDTHYTERYIGLPQENPEAYRVSNVLTYADQLEVPLLIIHGTADDNVYFVHALKMSDALFRAGKDHDFLPLAGFTHMVPDPLVVERLYTRVMSFFDEHLGAPRAAEENP